MKSLAVVMLLLTAVCASAQMMPTATQHKHLMKQREKLIQLQLKNSRLQADMAFVSGQFQQACREVVAENAWSADTQCELSTLTFYAPQKQSQPAAAKKDPDPAVK